MNIRIEVSNVYEWNTLEKQDHITIKIGNIKGQTKDTFKLSLEDLKKFLE